MMNKEIICVVEDEENIRQLIRHGLASNGFGAASYSIVLFESGEEMLDFCKENLPALFLLDIMLPGADGFELCRQIRQDSRLIDIPILMLTARGEEVDKVLGLELGADDYVTKPFSVRELAARARVLLRRSRALVQAKAQAQEAIALELAQAALLNNNMTRLDNQLSVNNNNANDISAAVKSGNESAKQAGTHQYIADVDNQIVIPSDIQMKIETKSQGSTKLINDKADIFQAENLRIDFAARKVFKNNKLIELSYKEFELLKLLVKNTGIALSRNTLLEKVWGYDFFGETRTVDVHIYNLRQKIEDDYNHPVFIETIRSIGYRFNADVR